MCVAVGVRFGLSLCVPDSCVCGDQVDVQDLHYVKRRMADSPDTIRAK